MTRTINSQDAHPTTMIGVSKVCKKARVAKELLSTSPPQFELAWWSRVHEDVYEHAHAIAKILLQLALIVPSGICVGMLS